MVCFFLTFHDLNTCKFLTKRQETIYHKAWARGCSSPCCRASAGCPSTNSSWPAASRFLSVTGTGSIDELQKLHTASGKKLYMKLWLYFLQNYWPKKDGSKTGNINVIRDISVQSLLLAKKRSQNITNSYKKRHFQFYTL